MARPPLAHIAALAHDRLRIYGQGNSVAKTGTTPWQLRDSERMIVGNAELLAQQHFLIGITRVRNEALILGDTLEFVGHMSMQSSRTTTLARTGRWNCSAITRRSR